MGIGGPLGAPPSTPLGTGAAEQPIEVVAIALAIKFTQKILGSETYFDSVVP